MGKCLSQPRECILPSLIKRPGLIISDMGLTARGLYSFGSMGQLSNVSLFPLLLLLQKRRTKKKKKGEGGEGNKEKRRKEKKKHYLLFFSGG